jgi:DNA adenine methylase
MISSIRKKKICFFPYIGGKFNLLKSLIPLIPAHKTYVEVFGGAASLLLNKPPSKVEVFNDADGELVNLFLVVRDHPQKFLKSFRLILYSREIYKRWAKEESPEDSVKRAVRFYYLLRSSFNGLHDGGWSFNLKRNKAKAFFNSLRQIHLISERLKNVQIDCLGFRKCIERYDRPETFFYLDPPYYALQYYRVKFSKEDHLDLRKILGKVRGKWLLTYNGHPKIRKMYSKFHLIEVEMPKTSPLKKEGEKRNHFKNLIITNYPLIPWQIEN